MKFFKRCLVIAGLNLVPLLLLALLPAMLFTGDISELENLLDSFINKWDKG